MIGFLLLAYAINYHVGKSINEKIAENWVITNKQVFKENYTQIGISKNPNDPLIDEENANTFKFYASGRANSAYALVTMELQRRQNLFAMFLFSFIWPEKDRICLEIPIEIKSPIPLIFAVIRKKEAKVVYGNNSDLKCFCKNIPYEGLENSYKVFSESSEVAEYMLIPQLVSILTAHEKIIQMIHITDQKIAKKLYLRADMLLPSQKRDYVQFMNIIKTIFLVIDRVANIKLSPQAKAKAENERVLYETMKQKEEAEKNMAAQKKKKAEEKKQKDEDSNLLSKEKSKSDIIDTKKKMSQKNVKSD